MQKQLFSHHAFRCALCVLAVLGTVAASTEVQADFTGNGDFAGDFVNFDVTLTPLTENRNDGDETSVGDLVVGDVGVAGLFGNGGLPFFFTDPDTGDPVDLKPLRSTNAIIGNAEGSYGAVTLEDFMFLPDSQPGGTAPFGGNWFIEDDLTVGNNGTGDLDLSTSARVQVEGITRVGGGDGSGLLQAVSEGTGLGLITINGTGSRLVNGDAEALTVPAGNTTYNSGDFLVGFNATGDVVVSGRGSIQTRGNAIVGVEDGGHGTVLISDRGSLWMVEGALTVGNGGIGGTPSNGGVDPPPTDATGYVQISDDAIVQVVGPVFVNDLGSINMLGGTLRHLAGASPISVPNEVANAGDITGDGFIDAAVTNNAGGVISNSSAAVVVGTTITSERELLRVSGAVVNNFGGLIQSEGGEMQFDSLVTNFGDIVARESILRFEQSAPGDTLEDLVNTGILSLGGDVTITGDVNNVGGQIVTLEDTYVLIQGDLDYTNGILTIISSDNVAPLTVTGAADLSEAAIDLALTTSVDSMNDGPFEILTAAGGVTAPIDNRSVFNGELFEFSVVGNTLVADLIGVAAPLGPDVNGDGFVNELDVQIWENNYPIAAGATTELGDADGDGDVDGADYLFIQGSFGPFPVSALAAVPEPSTVAMLLLAVVVCPRRRLG